MARLSLRLALDIVFEMPTDVTIRLAARDEQKSASKIFSGKLLWFGKNIAKSCSRTATRLNCPLSISMAEILTWQRATVKFSVSA